MTASSDLPPVVDREQQPREPRPSWIAPVQIVADYDEPRSGVTLNVSPGGMLVSTKAKLEVGETIRARFRLPSFDADTEAEAIVQWTSQGRAGLRFVALGAHEIRTIHRMTRSRA